MAQIITAKKTGKEIALAISQPIVDFTNWCCRGKQQDLQRAHMEQVVFNLKNCLRKVEIELMRVTDLSPSRMQELKAEKNKLLAEIDAVTRAAGLISPTLIDLLDELESETVVGHKIFFEKRPHLFYYLMVVLVSSFLGYGYFSMIIY